MALTITKNDISGVFGNPPLKITKGDISSVYAPVEKTKTACHSETAKGS